MAARISDALRVRPGPGRPASHRPGCHAAVQGRQGGGAGRRRRSSRRGWPSCRNGCSPRGARAVRAACCSCCRASTRPARAARSATSWVRWTRRGCASPRSARRLPRSAATTSCGGSGGGSPSPASSGVFDRSHYEDVVTVRVREARSARHVVAPVRRDQPLRGTGRRRRHADREVLPAHLGRRVLPPPARAAGGPDQALEVRPRPTSTTSASGTTTSMPTATRSSAATPSAHRGTSCRRIASGTATGRSPGC